MAAEEIRLVAAWLNGLNLERGIPLRAGDFPEEPGADFVLVSIFTLKVLAYPLSNPAS
jgi:hypothetical protein